MLDGAGPAEHTIWSLAKPIPQHEGREDLYAHGAGAKYARDRGWLLQPSGRLRSDRLLNVFPYGKWVDLTGVATLGLRVLYRGGACRVDVMAYDGQSVRTAATFRLPYSEELRMIRADLPRRHAAQFLFLDMEAEESTEVVDVSVVTMEEPRTAVRLGIVITTFNRPQDVEDQVALLEGLGLTGLNYRVIVVDNGRNLDLSRSYLNTEVIASVNLGGAGGFTRGLIEIMADGSWTHGMFMDDDAFCHPEAIVRAAALLSYAKRADLALTGAMNYTHAPEIQYELGGEVAPYGVRSLRMNVDTNNLQALRDNDAADTPAYGAWWCFIFPLKAVKVLPFPFFVRGDDITFSLQNSFKLETLPGLLAWQPSFEYKIGASVEYLVHRSFLTIPLVAERSEWTLTSILNGIRHAFDMEIDGLRYPIAEGVCAALEDVLTGPSFWLNAANTTARMQELGRVEKAFTARSFLPDWIFRPSDVEQRRSMRFLRARFGGLNIPARLCFRRPALTNDMFPKKGQAAFRRGMIYHAPDGSRSLSCARDWRWRRRVQQRFDRLLGEYERRFDELAQLYQSHHEVLQSLDAWKERLEMSCPGEGDQGCQDPELALVTTAEQTLAYSAL